MMMHTTLAQLRSLAGRLPTEREAAFRSWAARDPEAARVLAEVDQARVAHLAALHRGRGATDDHALTLCAGGARLCRAGSA